MLEDNCPTSYFTWHKVLATYERAYTQDVIWGSCVAELVRTIKNERVNVCLGITLVDDKIREIRQT